jgi:hypothetical protein
MGCVHGGEPKFLEKVSFIKMYTLNSCETPWSIYLQTGGRALGNLAMTLLWIDTGDLVRSFFRPKGTRSRYHSIPGLGRGKRRIKKGVFPEPSDLIADGTRSLTGLQKPKYSDGFNHIWTVDTHLQKILNKVLFVNMATDFAYDWFSGILLASRSKCHLGRFRATYEAAVDPDGQWHMGRYIEDSGFGDGATLNEFNIELGEGTWAVTLENRLTFLSGSPGTKVLHGIFVGPSEKLKVCGKLFELVVPASGSKDGETWTVISGPCFIRGMLKTLNGGGPDDTFLLKGFRIR